MSLTLLTRTFAVNGHLWSIVKINTNLTNYHPTWQTFCNVMLVCTRIYDLFFCSSRTPPVPCGAGSCARLRYHCFIERVHIDDRTAQFCNLAVKNAVIQGENTAVFRNYLGLTSTFERQLSEKVVFLDDSSRTIYLVNIEFPPTWLVFMEYEFEAASPRQLCCAWRRYDTPVASWGISAWLKVDVQYCRPRGDGVTAGVSGLAFQGGLLDRFTARYFYKGSETSLHKHTENLLENIFSTKCALKNYLQLLT